MQVVIVESAQQVALYGANYCVDTITQKPNAILGLATGSTPVALYKKLIDLHLKKKLSFQEIRSFNLDEYIGLKTTHPQSYRFFMNEHLFNHIDIIESNTHVPNGLIAADQASAEYEHKIKQLGGIDLQVLGVGRNGHIGFNEPSSSLASRTRVKTLAAGTMTDNSRFFNPNEFQPTLAITMGIGTILESKQILLLATGESKAQAVRDLIEGPLSASCPASA
ncbi:MAG: glucosamine-6-phosphate deaminase, partial [Oceanospirillaceae bacterium]